MATERVSKRAKTDGSEFGNGACPRVFVSVTSPTSLSPLDPSTLPLLPPLDVDGLLPLHRVFH